MSAATSAPLAQARVLLISHKNRRDVLTLITKEDGRFEFTGVPAGKYTLQGARRGYIAASYEQHEQYSTAIVTGPNLETENLTLRLTPMAMLTGTVLDEASEPVRGAQIRLFAESHRGGATRVVPISSETADDQGTFEFAPLAPGKYFACAMAQPWYAQHAASFVANTAVPVDPALDVVYPLTFYGGATDSASAQPITIDPGGHAQIEIRLTPAPALHIFYRAPQSSEHGFANPMLQQRIFDSVEGIGMGMTTSSTDVPDVEEIIGIPPGKYIVRSLSNGSSELDQESELDLRQSGQNLNDFAAQPLASIKFNVTLANGEAPPTRQTYLFLQREHDSFSPSSEVDANGKASFEALSPGKYTVRVSSSERAYSVVQMTSRDAQVAAPQLTLKPGESQEWTVVLASGRTTLEGLVKRGTQPASGIMVVLIPNHPEAHQDLFRRDQSDLDGSFTLRSVIPGSYTVVAVEDAWGFDWSQPLQLARYAAHGQAVTVNELTQGTFSLADAVQVQPR